MDGSRAEGQNWFCDGESVLTAFCPVKELNIFCSAYSVS